MSEQTRDEQIRTLARQCADFAKAWYVGEVDGRDDFRFVAHLVGCFSELAATVEQETREQDAPYMKHQHGCRSIWEPEHVCGLTGYNRMIDPPCPGCVGPQRIVGCTCGLSAIRQQGQEDRS